MPELVFQPPVATPVILAEGRSQGETYAVRDDALHVSLYNALAGATFKVVARILDPDGVVRVAQKALLVTSDRSQQVTRLWLPTGRLLMASVVATAGTPRRGQSWAVVSLESTLPSGVTTLCPIAQGYVTSGSALLWPGGPYGNSVEGPGMIRSVTGTNPAAGAEILETVPTGARWKLHAVWVELVTDATVINRTASFVIDDGTLPLLVLPGATTQAASLTYGYWLAEYGYLPTAVATEVFFNLASLGQLAAGYDIISVTTNLQAGDNWAAPQMLVEEWIEP